MFEFDHPAIQRGEEPNLAHAVIAGTAFTVVLFVMAFTPDPASRYGGFALHLLEFAPSILMLLATRFGASTPATAGPMASRFPGAVRFLGRGSRPAPRTGPP